jgi:hypothetical protein
MVLGYIVKEKINTMFLLAPLKTLNYSERRIRVCIPAFFRCHCNWSIFSSKYVTGGFQKNFQNHRRLSEKLLESQAAI